MKDQVFNGIPVPRDCTFCKYHPSNSAKTGGTQPTDVQQLKAKIRSLLDENGLFIKEVLNYNGMRELFNKLRELSAVQRDVRRNSGVVI